MTKGLREKYLKFIEELTTKEFDEWIVVTQRQIDKEERKWKK